jgi:SH3-like domain-containing protein
MVLAAGICFAQSAGSALYVSVKSADVKSGTGFFSGRIETLKLGDAVTLVSEKGKWYQVRTSKNTGWAPRDSFSTRRVVASGSATASEVALAGKGFSAEAETVYQKDGLDYAPVDAMEKITVPLDELQKFVNDGRLNGGE